jgi:O-antigen ligase
VAIAITLVLVFLVIRKTPLRVMGAVLGILVFSAFLGPIVVQRLGTLDFSKAERSLMERVRYYTAAWHIFRAYPVLGLGWGCDFNVRDIVLNGRYVPPPQRAYIGARPSWTQATVHSAYLQVLVRLGLVGLAALLLFLWSWFRAVVRTRHSREKEPLDFNLLVGVACALMGYFAHAGLENFFQWPVMAQSFWLLLGLTTVMAHRLTRDGTFEPLPPVKHGP